tara:strand:- start:15 stop:137 length:123 start_codon:yes stop_codon:yes gene_type:complete
MAQQVQLTLVAVVAVVVLILEKLVVQAVQELLLLDTNFSS